MMDVAIIGAGELGGSLAHVLARREIVGRIQLIDPSGQVAAGKALDIMQAGPVEGFTTPVFGSTDLSRVAGCALVIIADQLKPEPGADSILLLMQLKQLASRAVVLCAGVDGRVLVERGVRELKYPRTRLIASAPEALTAAVRAVVALQTNGSVRDVALCVLGAPPANAFVSWDDARSVASRPRACWTNQPFAGSRRRSVRSGHRVHTPWRTQRRRRCRRSAASRAVRLAASSHQTTAWVSARVSSPFPCGCARPESSALSHLRSLARRRPR